MSKSPTVMLISDCRMLVSRLLPLARTGELSHERLEAIVQRLTSELGELRELIEVEEAGLQPLPLVAMRFHGRFGVIDGGLT